MVSDGSGNTFFTNLGELQDVVNAGTLSLNWNFDTDITDTDPGSGKFKRNNATLSNVTFLYYNIISSDGVDSTIFLSKLTSGDFIYFQEMGDSTTFEYYQIVGKPINATTYIKVPVSLQDSGSIQINKNNLKCGHIFFFTGSRGISKGSTFPTTPDNGDVFYRTDTNLIYQYDISRLKWLSVDRQSYTCGRNSTNGNVAGYFGVADLQFTSTEGFKMPRNGTILSVTFINATAVTRDIQFRVNNSTTNMFTLSLTATNTSSSTIVNLDFNANDLIQVVAAISAGNTLTRAIAIFEVAWRV